MLEGISKRSGEPIKRHYGMVMAAVSMAFFLWACQHQAPAPSGLTYDAPPSLVQSAEAKEIFDKHIEAVGGRKALNRIQTKKTVSKSILDQKNIQVYVETTTFQQRPDKYYAISKGTGGAGSVTGMAQRINRKLKGKVLAESGTDGRMVWEQGGQGTSIKHGIERVNHLLRYAFDMLQYETPYIGWELIGTKTVKDQLCYKLAITPHKGTPHHYFVNQESLLIDKIAYSTGSGQKLEPEEIFLYDYKKIDGIQIAHKFKIYRSDRLFLTGVVDTVETNIAIPADRFAAPSAIQELARNQFGPDAFNYSPLTKEAPVSVASRPEGRSRVVKTHYDGKLLREKYTMVGNVKHGPYTSYYPNGQIMIKESYVRDKPHGDSLHYDSAGNLTQKERYHLGKLNGQQIFYCTDGAMKTKLNYRMGTYHGRAELYHQCSGILAELSFYDNGLLEGERTVYFADGKIQEKTSYQAGKPHGTSVFYHANGSTEAEKKYETGTKTGQWKYYYDSGKVKAEENYRADQFHGSVKSYYPSGVLRQETAFRSGLKHGTHQYFYKNGKPKDQTQYKEGKLSGIKKQYAWSGYLWLEESYQNDVLDGPTRRYAADGKVIKVLHYQKGQLVPAPK